MKKIITIINLSTLVILLSLMWNLTTNKGVDNSKFVAQTKDRVTLTQDIEPFFDQFISDCEIEDIKPDHAYCLEYIQLASFDDLNGCTNKTDKNIQISYMLMKDTIGLKMTLYHELGHWFGLEHVDAIDIMMPSYTSCEDSAWVRDNWAELKINYFKKLRDI